MFFNLEYLFMPAPSSNDLRKRIIVAKVAKLKVIPEVQIAPDKAVHKSTVRKLWALYRSSVETEKFPIEIGKFLSDE